MKRNEQPDWNVLCEPTSGKQTQLHGGGNILAARALVRHPHRNTFLVIDLPEKGVRKMLFSKMGMKAVLHILPRI
jgi:hypothetical protein